MSGYDGNLITFKGALVTHDAEKPPTTLGNSLTVGYTGSGLRAWKLGSGVKTFFLYDGAAPVCELDGSGNVLATNTFGGAGLLSRHTSTGSTFYTFDERGNVAQRLNAAGTPTSSSMYDAYGASAAVSPDPFGFGGQFGYYTDSETGLQLCQHRYYDSSVGRFLTRDPAGYAGGLNLYAYCANNPVSSADPSGFNSQSDGGDGPFWYDRLANASDFGNNAQKNSMNDFYAGDPTHLVATLANTALDLGNGLLHVPSTIGHLGEKTGNFAGDPTLANSAGVFGDAVTAVSVVLPFLAPEAEALEETVINNCFVADTAVQMVGETTKPVQEVKVGDMVQSRNPKTGKTEIKRVLRLSKRTVTSVLTLSLADKTTGKVVQTITCTPGHPFNVEGTGFVLAGDLALGNSIVTRAGPSLIVEKIEAHHAKGGYIVYNFEVQGNHTYFVGTANGGVWVHNTSVPSNPPGTSVPTPRFVASPNGTVVEVPPGYVGRVADNGKGLVYQDPGSSGNANQIRIADPNGLYPNGYYREYNSAGQPINLATGKPGPNADTHTGF